MKYVASLAVDRLPSNSKSEPFWHAGVNRLVLVVSSTNDNTDNVIAYGVDPSEKTVLFQVAGIPVARLGELFQAVVNGDHIEPDSNGVITLRLGGSTDLVVVPDPGPTDTGPKVVQLAVAAAVTVELATPTRQAS